MVNMFSIKLAHFFFICYIYTSNFSNKNLKNTTSPYTNLVEKLNMDEELCDVLIRTSEPSIKNFTYPIYQRNNKITKKGAKPHTCSSIDYEPSTSYDVQHTFIGLDNKQPVTSDNICPESDYSSYVKPNCFYDKRSATIVKEEISKKIKLKNFSLFASTSTSNNTLCSSTNSNVNSNSNYTHNLYTTPQGAEKHDLQTISNIQDTPYATNCNRNAVLPLINKKVQVRPLVPKSRSMNEVFFYATVNCLKTLLYYRYNISKFFITFSKQLEYEGEHDRKPLKIWKFIELSMQFAINSDNNVGNNVKIADANELNEIKKYENWLINNCKNNRDCSSLEKSKEFKEIKRYNKHYLIALNARMQLSAFKSFYNFLFPYFIQKIPLSKHFPMLVSLITSLNDLAVIIDKKIDKALQVYLLDTGVFEVKYCFCSREIKQYFFFHWAFCWISCFSNYFSLPESANHKKDTLVVINTYPKEFFTQLILIVHTVVNFNNENIVLQDLENNFVFNLRSKINELLFEKTDFQFNSRFMNILQELFANIVDICNHKIYEKYSVVDIRIIQTFEENLEKSNELVPFVTNLVHEFCNLAKESYLQAKFCKKKLI